MLVIVLVILLTFGGTSLLPSNTVSQYNCISCCHNHHHRHHHPTKNPSYFFSHYYSYYSYYYYFSTLLLPPLRPLPLLFQYTPFVAVPYLDQEVEPAEVIPFGVRDKPQLLHHIIHSAISPDGMVQTDLILITGGRGGGRKRRWRR